MRVDYGIIMARGDSARMGSPKGACLIQGKSLLELSCSVFDELDIPVVIVTTPSLLKTYKNLVNNCNWLLFPEGHGTARTCKYAYNDLSEQATHFWLMPLDLPSVKTETATIIQQESINNPDSIIVPFYKGQRGHPVVMPVESFKDVDEELWQLEMRDVIESLTCSIINLQVDDCGIIEDCDTQSDLEK